MYTTCAHLCNTISAHIFHKGYNEVVFYFWIKINFIIFVGLTVTWLGGVMFLEIAQLFV